MIVNNRSNKRERIIAFNMKKLWQVERQRHHNTMKDANQKLFNEFNQYFKVLQGDNAFI